MSDTISETKACDLLTRLFRARGYTMTRNQLFREYGVSFHIDGWDAKARVGFEFLTSEDDDHDDLTLTEYKALMTAQQRGELALLILDEVEPVSAAELTAIAHEFLDEVAEARQARRQAAPRKKGKKKAAVKKKRAATKRPPVKKTVRTVKKSAKKKKR